MGTNPSLATDKYDVEMLQEHLTGLVQDGSNSIANALELLQSCTKPSRCSWSIPS